MILVIQSSYCQYPTTKRIKGDSVVIMRIGQADTINMLYKSYNDTISVLKDSLTTKAKNNVVLLTQVRYKEDTIKNYKWKLENYPKNEAVIAEMQKLRQVSGFTVFLMFMISMAIIVDTQNK